MITSAIDVAALGTILGIWAHPDDEAYLSGGLMALARANGQRVVCVTATRGELGTADPATWPPDRLAAERTRELADCLAILGVREHHWLGYRDGGVRRGRPVGAVDRCAELIARGPAGHRADLRPGRHDRASGPPDGLRVDRCRVRRGGRPGARLLHAAIAGRGAERWATLDESLGVYLPRISGRSPRTERLAVDLVLDPDVAARKVRALAAQATQTAGLIAVLGRRHLHGVGRRRVVRRVARGSGLDVVSAC